MSEDTWRTIAEGEAAAVYAYGVLIPRLQSAQRPTARDALIFHSRQRDAAIAELAAMGVAIELPVVFEIPFAIKTASDAARLAANVENRLVNIYCTVAAVFSGDQHDFSFLIGKLHFCQAFCIKSLIAWCFHLVFCRKVYP